MSRRPDRRSAISLTGIVLKVARRIVFDLAWLAASTPRAASASSAPDCIPDACFGERDRAPCGGSHLRLALPVNQSIKPEIKCDQWNAGENRADDDRKNIPARESAH